MSDLILDTGRAVGTLLAPLMGTRARGKVIAKARTSDVFVPRNAVMIPILNDERWEAGTLRVAHNEAKERGSDDGWVVTAAGTEIDVVAAFGGPNGNLPGGTVGDWEMPIPGLEPAVHVEAAGISGGVAPDCHGVLRAFCVFEDVGHTEPWETLVALDASSFPAAIMYWLDSTPADDVTDSRTGRGGVRVGRGRQLYTESWTLELYTSRGDSDSARKREGLTLLQSVSELLTDRQSIDGIPISSPAGITIKRRYRVTRDPRWYCYAIDFTTTHCLTMRDERTWNDWLTTRLGVLAPAPAGSEQPSWPMVDDNVIDMR